MAPAAVGHLAVGAMLKDPKVATLCPIIALVVDHDKTRNAGPDPTTKSLCALLWSSSRAQFAKPCGSEHRNEATAVLPEES